MYKTLEMERNKRIAETLSIIKLLSLFFSSIILFGSERFVVNGFVFLDKGVNLTTQTICAVVFICIYQIWVSTSKKDCDTDLISVSGIIEILMFIAFFTFFVIISNGCTSQYKFLFLFVIIPATIQYGMKYGMITAVASTVIILIIDLIGFTTEVVNPYFETDLILSGVFILTAWLLGYYVKVEKDHREYMARLVNMDELTEVYNHRYFQDSLIKELENAETNKQSLPLLLIDIDDFKYYNDVHGHMYGDEVLKQLAEILKNCVRLGDIVSRYGGEEFTIILPDTGEQQALSIAERIRKAVEEQAFYGEENQPKGKLTVSIGVALFPEKAKNKKELLNNVDDALQRAKAFNKNRVELYATVLEEIKKDLEDEYIDLAKSIRTSISVVNAKDQYTYGHTERVVIFCELAAEYLHLNEHDRKVLRYGAYLHDMGKVEIPMEILNKKMPLTQGEWQITQQHPENGVQIIKTAESLQEAVPLIMHHHEKYDGTGYPDHLKGEQIPYLARVLAVADSFDAMTSNRPYKKRKSYDEAVEEIQKCSLTQFDPEIAKVFVDIIQKNKENFARFK